jgi:serine/threonine protein kinase
MKTLGKNKYTVEFFEIHETRNSIYIVLEYLEGETLFDSLHLESPSKK